MKKLYLRFAALFISATMLFTGCSFSISLNDPDNSQVVVVDSFTAPDRNDQIPYYSYSPYTIVNNNEPYF